MFAHMFAHTKISVYDFSYFLSLWNKKWVCIDNKYKQPLLQRLELFFCTFIFDEILQTDYTTVWTTLQTTALGKTTELK